jgi:hypothetical protein
MRDMTRTAVAMERLDKHVSVETNSCNSGGAVFSVLSVPMGYKKDKGDGLRHTRVEAGSNTSTVTLRVLGGDEKGSLKSETVKYGRKSQGART